MVDDDAPLIDDIGIARLLAKLRAIRDHDPAYGLTKSEFVDRAEEIAVRHALREAQRQRRQRRLEVPLDGMLPHQLPALPDFVDRLVDQMDLCIAIDRLSRHERQVVIQSFVLKRSIRDIATHLGLSQKVTRAIRTAAIAKIRLPGTRNANKGVTSTRLSQDGIVGQNGEAP